MNLEEILNDEDFTFSSYFKYLSTLGHGSYGYVVLGVSKVTLETMAIKVIPMIFRLLKNLLLILRR